MAEPHADEAVGQDREADIGLRLLPRAPRAELERPVLDGPFTETKEVLTAVTRRAGPQDRPPPAARPRSTPAPRA